MTWKLFQYVKKSGAIFDGSNTFQKQIWINVKKINTKDAYICDMNILIIIVNEEK